MKVSRLTLITLILLNSFVLCSQDIIKPELPDTTDYGKYTSRTMNLLRTSTSGEPKTVKILVYGQSISAQDWWIEVKETIQKRFPNANLIMENKAIGGFASQMLYKTVEMDVSTFYPDLVLLHIYGSNVMYDSVLYTIRSRTAAEIAIQTDHFTGENAWSDSMSYNFLPAMAEKYKCDLINIRDPWKKYLRDNKLEPKDLLTDQVHLNKKGEKLMAELIEPLFVYKSKFQPDPFGLCIILKAGRDFKLKKGKLKLPFTGNRVDIVSNGNAGKATVLIDGASPSSFPGTYFMTRPYSENGKGWPWNLPAMIRIQHKIAWVSEEWTCKFTEATPPYDNFSFEISGSVTGKDGSGQAKTDFISNSGRVIIGKDDAEQGGDWHLNRSYKVLKTIVNTGDEVKWKTYTASTDVWETDDESVDITTLFQGVSNSRHALLLVPEGNSILPISEIRVYRPFFNRSAEK